MENTLRVRRKGRAMVPDYRAADAGVHDRYIGWTKVQGEVVIPKTEFSAEVNTGRFVANDDVVTVPARVEYLRDLKDGMLAPADAATARAAGVPFTAPAPKKPAAKAEGEAPKAAPEAAKDATAPAAPAPVKAAKKPAPAAAKPPPPTPTPPPPAVDSAAPAFGAKEGV